MKDPIVLMVENKMIIAIALAITQMISSVMINLVQPIGIFPFIAVAKTNSENTIRKIPTMINGVLSPISNNCVNTDGRVANKTPVIPELTALVSSTFFSVIISLFLLFQKYCSIHSVELPIDDKVLTLYDKLIQVIKHISTFTT